MNVALSALVGPAGTSHFEIVPEVVALPEREQQEARLLGWIAATERYPDQLLEMDRAAYLVMKRAEVLRQQTPP